MNRTQRRRTRARTLPASGLLALCLAAAGSCMTTPALATGSNPSERPASGKWSGTLPTAPEGPYARVYYPQNAPSAPNQVGFPHHWHAVYGNPQHNAAYAVGSNAPKWLRQGVGWNYAEARAWPLSDSRPFANEVYGTREALPVQTQFMGNALGVTGADGVIYA